MFADTHTIRIPCVYGFGELDGPGLKPSAFIVMEALDIRGRWVKVWVKKVPREATCPLTLACFRF